MTRAAGRARALALACLLVAPAAARAQAAAQQPVDPPAAGAPVHYVVTFPEPEHHWLQVEATFADLGRAPLDVRMSRSSPGRYAPHEFAKNVFAFDAFDGSGRRLEAERTGADEWRVPGHDGTVRVVYRLFGDHADGTYLAVDTTHAHLNMPATFAWARGLDGRAIDVRFTPPATSNWVAATQLYPSAEPFHFTAPNLQYFMDSPVELAPVLTSTFDVVDPAGRPAHFRVMAHTQASQADVDALAARIARLVREAAAVFGEFPAFEPGHYTFILDFVGWAEVDAMEHRNSTYISSPYVDLRGADGQRDALDMIAHEFFHVWNVERLRPAGLEPFDFTRENVTCCLWMAEGFTEYYGPLLLERAGLIDLGARVASEALDAAGSDARGVRSAVETSEQAPFADAGVANDVTDRSRTFVSYYTLGAGIALALDFSLRDRSDDRVSLDDYMRLLWTKYAAAPGTPGTPAVPDRPAVPPGYVAHPYTLADLRATLAELTGDRAFADDFFDRYVEGRETPDFARLLAAVGVGDAPREPWIGAPPPVSAEPGAIRLGSADPRPGEWLTDFGSPLYAAGLDAGDRIVSIDDEPATVSRWQLAIRRAPGTRLALAGLRRDGRPFTTSLVIGERSAGPRVLTPADALTPAQRARLDAWLGSRAR